MGGGKIKDATATPQDVMTGKVFYNNEGRQVGLADIFPYFTAKIPKNAIGAKRYFQYKELYTGGDESYSYGTPRKYIISGRKSTIISMDNNFGAASHADVCVSPMIDVKNIREINIVIGSYNYTFNFFLHFRGTGNYCLRLNSATSSDIYIDTQQNGVGHLFFKLKNDVLTEIGLFARSSETVFNLMRDCIITIR